MSPSLEALKATLAGLPHPERAELAHFLLESLEEGAGDVTEAWRSELVRRVQEIRSGTAIVKPVEQVLARLRKEYP